MKAYDENAKYILFINKSITILGCSTVNSLTIGFLGYISQQDQPPPCQATHQINWDATFIFGVKEGESFFHTSLKFLTYSTHPIILCDIK